MSRKKYTKLQTQNTRQLHKIKPSYTLKHRDTSHVNIIQIFKRNTFWHCTKLIRFLLLSLSLSVPPSLLHFSSSFSSPLHWHSVSSVSSRRASSAGSTSARATRSAGRKDRSTTTSKTWRRNQPSCIMYDPPSPTEVPHELSTTHTGVASTSFSSSCTRGH